ncbi:MAG: hypothetical protein KME49_01930 [Brasilonema octagenarum HA4186-MV1]|nr:hypothetical protein [Brasilonema octagenarum HA4186-MV1]
MKQTPLPKSEIWGNQAESSGHAQGTLGWGIGRAESSGHAQGTRSPSMSMNLLTFGYLSSHLPTFRLGKVQMNRFKLSLNIRHYKFGKARQTLFIYA